MTNKSCWCWLLFMSFIISSQPHSTGSTCLKTKKHLLNGERWEMESPPTLAIWWLHSLTAVYVCHFNTHGHFWEIWFCVYQFHFCYCGNFGQAITWEWTVPIWSLYVNHFTSLLSVEHLENVRCFHIGRPTTDKAWLCSASVVMAMPLQRSARA